MWKGMAYQKRCPILILIHRIVRNYNVSESLPLVWMRGSFLKVQMKNLMLGKRAKWLGMGHNYLLVIITAKMKMQRHILRFKVKGFSVQGILLEWMKRGISLWLIVLKE